MFYRVSLGFDSVRVGYSDLQWVLLGFTGFLLDITGFAMFYQVKLGFSWIWVGYSDLQWVLLGFTGFLIDNPCFSVISSQTWFWLGLSWLYWVSICFTGFYCVTQCYTGFDCVILHFRVFFIVYVTGLTIFQYLDSLYCYFWDGTRFYRVVLSS